MSRGKIREKKPALVGLDAELSELPRVLKEMRLNAKMTGKAAGDELCARGFSHKTHYSALSRYENGFRVPLLRIFIALCLMSSHSSETSVRK